MDTKVALALNVLHMLAETYYQLESHSFHHVGQIPAVQYYGATGNESAYAVKEK